MFVDARGDFAAGMGVAWGQVQGVGLRARDERTVITDERTGMRFVPGETSANRTIYNAVALLCVIVLSVLLGFRAKTLYNNAFRKRNFTSMLVAALFVFGLGFIICASIVQTGQGLRTHQLCYSSAMICLVFYTGNKLTIYIFLLERARVVRAPFMPRHKDFIWLIGLVIMLGGFGSIAIVGYLSPVVELSHLDGRCRIGLPPKVSFPLLCFDVAVNFLLTGVFFWLLRPVIEFHGIMRGRNWCGLWNRKAGRETRDVPRSQESESLQSAMNVNIKALLWKCLIGSALVMLPTVGNMAQFYAMDSRELGWVCLTICTFDMSWGVIIVNWLTIGSAKAESNLNTLMSQRTLCNNSNNEVAPFLRLQGKRKHGFLSTGVEMKSGNFTPPKAQEEMLCEVISFKDEGGLLKNDRVSKVWDVEREVGIEEPGRSWQGRGAENAVDNNGKRFTL